MEKGTYIREIRPGDKVEGLFCVAQKALRTARNGSPFLTITLTDKTGQMEARVWENAEKLNGQFDQGDILLLKASAVEFADKCQLKVNALKVAPEEDMDPSLFLPTAPCDLDKAWKICKKAMGEIKEPALALLLKEIFQDRQLKQDFCQAPAAKKMHHAYIGGLLEHSASLVELARLVTGKYGHLDRDLLICGSLLHDIGKTRELSWKRPPIDYSHQGRLLGHINLGMEIIERACRELGIKAENEKVLALKHIILSHHGQREFGSPVLPMTEEAMVFHMLDDLDAKLNFLSGLKDSMGEAEGNRWSSYQRLFERYFYLPPLSAGEEVAETGSSDRREDGKVTRKQPLLWSSEES